MATAICTFCARGTHYDPKVRKLKELLCPCGGKLTQAVEVEDGKYEPRGGASYTRISEHWQAHGMKWDGFAKEESYGSANY